MSILQRIFGGSRAKKNVLDRFERALADCSQTSQAALESVSSLQRSVAVNEIVRQEQTKTIRKLAKESGLECATQCQCCKFFTKSGEQTGVCSNKHVKMTVRMDHSCPHFEAKAK